MNAVGYIQSMLELYCCLCVCVFMVLSMCVCFYSARRDHEMAIQESFLDEDLVCLLAEDALHKLFYYS